MSPVPEVVCAADIRMSTPERALLQQVHRDYARIVVEKEFGGGYSGTRVFLVLPVKPDGRSDARVVTKLGPVSELDREYTNYKERVERVLPFSATQVRDYTELAGQAALNYVFAGGESLGQTVSLEEYYLAQPAEVVKRTLDNLLDRTLGPRWYQQSQPLNCLFRDEYGRHLPPVDELEKTVKAIFPDLVPMGDDRIQIRGVAGTYPDPLKFYPRLLDQTLEGRQSFVHGDLHLRNVLVDQTGKGWLIDFAKVRERHNLFDFIKLEAYVRLMALAPEHSAFSWKDYARFEDALNDATLGRRATPPSDPHLAKAYAVVLAIRQITRNYLGDRRNFRQEYLPALFLYSLSLLKYFPSNGAAPTQSIFLTTCALGQCLLAGDQPADETKPAAGAVSSTVEAPAMPPAQPSERRQRRAPTGPPGGDNVGNITVGSISNSSGVAIGPGASATVTNTSGAAVDDIARAFALIIQKMDELPEGPGKSIAQAAVQGLATEAKQGEQAEENRVRKWFAFLAEAAPDVLEVVINTFINPIAGLGTVFKKVAERAKSEREAGRRYDA